MKGSRTVIAAVVKKSDANSALDVGARCLLSTVPGFANTGVGDEPIKSHLAIVRAADQRRTIVTAKWSIWADRERQFAAEFADYVC